MAARTREKTAEFPKQKQEQFPGKETQMSPQPLFKGEWYKGSGKLKGKTALITGGDSGIGRSAAIFFAREGADLAIVYLNEHQDAEDTKRMVEEEGGRCILIAGDVSDEKFCKDAVKKVVEDFGKLDILVNNAVYEVQDGDIATWKTEDLDKSFRTNIYSYFYMVREAINYLTEDSSIINTTSVNAYKGNDSLISYSSTKGAIVSFTRSLAQGLADKGIRVNAVAPGPVWTPLIPATSDPESIQQFGTQVPMKRAGQPEEIAPSFVFLASRDSSYMTGQVLHPNGGEIVNA